MRTWVKHGQHRHVRATTVLFAVVALCLVRVAPAVAWQVTQPSWHIIRIERDPLVDQVGQTVDVLWYQSSVSISAAMRANGSYDETGSGTPFTGSVEVIRFDADGMVCEVNTQYNDNLIVTPDGRRMTLQAGVNRVALANANGAIITTQPVLAQLVAPTGQLYNDDYSLPTAVMAVNEPVVLDTVTTGPLAISSMPTVTASIDASSGSLEVVLSEITDTGVLTLGALSTVCLGVAFASRWRGSKKRGAGRV